MALTSLEIQVGNPSSPDETEGLESLGLSLDPLRRDLRPMPMVL